MSVLGVLPERLNTSHASWDDVWDLRNELRPIDGFFRSDTEFCVAIEQEDRQHHNPGSAVVDQRFPSVWTQRYGVEKAASPIGRDNLTLRSLPEDRVKIIRIVGEAGHDFVVTAHDRAED
jgi:hypothetical protein